LARPDYAPVAESLRGIGVASAVDLFSTYAGQKSDLGPWLKGAEINRDRDLRLQYLAGWGIDSQLRDQIYNQMSSYRRQPGNLFTGSPERVSSVLQAISSGSRF
jgi:spermidine synthase